MIFSLEELSFLKRQTNIHSKIARQSTTRDLNQARLAYYFGAISKESFLSITADSGRKAQNHYHYMSIVAQPYFNELTVRYF